MIKVLGLTLYGSRAASSRYRILQYTEGLRRAGIDIEFSPLLGNAYLDASYKGEKYSYSALFLDYFRRMTKLIGQKRYDLAIVQAELFPFMPGLIDADIFRIPYIYDFDDSFHLKYTLERFKGISFLLADKFVPVISRSSAVLAGNQYLADFAKGLNRQVYVLPTVVDTNRYVAKARTSCGGGVFTVGWIGSPSTSVYLSQLHSPLSRLGLESPLRFIVVGGHCEPIPNVEVVVTPWSESTEIDLINTFDVGVMPLFDDEWARGKCAFKLIQYMGCGIPVVASPVGANVEVVDEASGFLARSSDEWADCLRRLRDNPHLRSSMGREGRARVERRYSLDVGIPIMVEAIRSVASRK